MKKHYPNHSIYAVLGFLSECEMSGYDIRKRTEETISYFWHESEGHLYPTLKRMTKLGLIEEAGGKKRNSRKRKQLCITDLGKEKLSAWLSEPISDVRMRSPFLLKLFFSKKMKAAGIREHLERELFKRKEQLAVYQRIQNDIQMDEKADMQSKLWAMTLDYGLRQTECWISWLKDSIKILG